MTSTRIFLHELSWDLRSRNTDWRYVRYALPQIHSFQPDLAFTSERSRLHAFTGNFQAVRSAALRRIGSTPDLRGECVSRVPIREVRDCGCHAIFSRTLPLHTGGIPVIWENAIVDPDMQRSYGATEQDLQREAEVRGGLFQHAAAVQVFSDAEAERHRKTFPHIASKFVPVPWFAPHIQACPAQVLEKHHQPEQVRILFVGNHAFRKGLDKLLEAFLALPPSLQKRSHLTIISNFDRSRIAVPRHPFISVLQGAPSARVMQEMARAHIFVNVARLETYGVVFHEAMAQGAACLAPAWEVQRELFDDGRAGVNLPCDAVAIRSALESLITDDAYRHRLAHAGWQRFQQRYAPAVVAERYATLFRSVAHGSGALQNTPDANPMGAST